VIPIQTSTCVSRLLKNSSVLLEDYLLGLWFEVNFNISGSQNICQRFFMNWMSWMVLHLDVAV
jgi:hypothetical protein